MPSRLVLRLVLRGVVLALALAPTLALASGQEETARIVERVLVVVDERPMLLSEMEAVMAVRGLAPEAALEASIDERLMLQEASRLPQAAVSHEEAETALSALLEKRPELDRLSRTELLRLVRRQAVILRYVEFRFRPQIRISDDDVRAAWIQEVGAGGPSLEEADSEIRARLERGALDQRIEDWVRRLRDRAEVRYVEGPRSPPRAREP
jgi:hypothetical protein